MVTGFGFVGYASTTLSVIVQIWLELCVLALVVGQ